MKAIILAAGFGTRLRPITEKIPKCLVEIKGKPLLDIWIENLVKIGINSILINTHYLSDIVQQHLNKNTFNHKLIINHEPVLLGTGGTLLKNIEFFGNEEGFLIHADNYCLDDLTSMIDAHKKRPEGCLITILVFETEDPSSCGIVETNSDGVIINFFEKIKSPPGNLANGAIYLLSKEAIDIIKKNHEGKSDFITEILMNFLGKIYAYKTNQSFIDIGTIENLKKANSI